LQLQVLQDQKDFELEEEMADLLGIAASAAKSAATRQQPTERQQALNASLSLLWASEPTRAWLETRRDSGSVLGSSP